MSSLLIQTAIATGTGGLSPTEAIGAAVGCLTLIAGIYKLGKNDAKTEGLKASLSEALSVMGAKLDAIARHIDESQIQRVEDAEWKGDINSRLGTVEREMGEVRDGVQDARSVAGAARALAEATDRRTGPADRRHPS